ncbi:hypothetical protein HDU98_009279 [Podochytrium sp. JEL0797]|nr:hypothetical protein HDU98_009279 [Podochytrium sp. JEL0797]
MPAALEYQPPARDAKPWMQVEPSLREPLHHTFHRVDAISQPLMYPHASIKREHDPPASIPPTNLNLRYASPASIVYNAVIPQTSSSSSRTSSKRAWEDLQALELAFREPPTKRTTHVSLVRHTTTAVSHSSTSNPSGRFVMPRPGLNGADPAYLQGMIIVLTGIFPEIGGGTGLNLGKERLKEMLQSFGAKVTGSVSGHTNLLVVGRSPGASKVTKAREQERCQLIIVQDLVAGIEGQKVLGEVEAPEITSFSSGYHGNALRIVSIGSQRVIERARFSRVEI